MDDELMKKRYKLINDIMDLVPGITFDMAAEIYNYIYNRLINE